MKKVLAWCLAAVCTGGLALAKPVSLEMRLEAPCTTADQKYELRGHALCLSPDTVLTASDIVSAERVERPTNAVRLTVNAPAAARLKVTTGAHVSSRLGIVFNGRLVSAPVIRDPISGGKIEFTGLSGGDVDELLQTLGKSE